MKIVDNYIKKKFKNLFTDFRGEFLRGEIIGNGDTNINTDNAMKYTAVFACVRVLAETLASTPIKIYKTGKDGERETANDIDLYDILHNKPNDEMSPFNFKEMLMNELNLNGNAVCKKLFNARRELVGLQPYKDVKIERNKETQKLEYKIKIGNVEETLQRKDVFHITGMSLDGINGLSPIAYASKAIRLGMSYEDFGVNFYKNGANPSMALEYPEHLGDEAFERLKKEFAKAYQGLSNTGKPIILEDGAKVKELTMKLADAQLLESKKFQIEDIARIYRVPLHLIQNLDKATNNNIEHQSLEFVMYTMLPWFQRWEENINMQLLTKEQRKKGYYVEFQISNLLRGDAKSRAESYEKARLAGYMSVNEIRKLENLNNIGEKGDIYIQPLNYIDVSQKQEVESEEKGDEADEKVLGNEEQSE